MYAENLKPGDRPEGHIQQLANQGPVPPGLFLSPQRPVTLMAARTYTPEQRQQALELYSLFGPCRAAKDLAIPKSTIVKWAKAAGLQPPTDNIDAAAKAREARIALKRAKLKELLITKAVDLVTRMDEPHIDFKSGGNLGPVEVKFPKAPAKACHDYAFAAAILLDKFRLENGEVTGREEVVTIDAVDREIQRLEAELDRRGALDRGDPEALVGPPGETGEAR